MHALTTVVYETIKRNRLLNQGDTVLVALSGGADSVALLRILVELQEGLGISHLVAMHVHHGLRGEYADRDERFVKELCHSLNVPLTCIHVDTQKEAQSHKESLEEAGRRLRYAFFKEQAALYSHAKIATAHTASDQVETVLFRLVRGTGLKGICGIPVKRDSIIRPLIDCSGEDVRACCHARDWSYIVDETNLDTTFTRNQIRHDIIPCLKQINPQTEQAILRFSQIATQENQFLDKLAQDLFERVFVNENRLNITLLQQADPVLQKRVICKWLPDLTYARVEEITSALQNGGVVNISDDRSVVADNNALLIAHMNRCKDTFEQPEQTVVIDQLLSFGNRTFMPVVLSYQEYCEIAKIHKNLFNFCISYDMIKDDLFIRSRKQGDRFRPYRRNVSKSIKKFLIEQKIPCDQRFQIPILIYQTRVLSLIGESVDESVAISSKTERILWFREL